MAISWAVELEASVSTVHAVVHCDSRCQQRLLRWPACLEVYPVGSWAANEGELDVVFWAAHRW